MKIAKEFYKDAGALLENYFDDYSAELLSISALYNKDGLYINEYMLEELKDRAERLAAACNKIIEMHQSN